MTLLSDNHNVHVVFFGTTICGNLFMAVVVMETNSCLGMDIDLGMMLV